MTNTDTEFDFDCPRYSYELVTVSGQSSVVDIKHIDQWFLKYHAEHDRKSLLQPEATKEKSLFGRPSVANTMKATSSLVGSARSLKRPSTVSAISSTAQISTLSARRCSQKSDEQNGDSGRNDQSVKNCRISIGSKRKSCLDQDGDGPVAPRRTRCSDGAIECRRGAEPFFDAGAYVDQGRGGNEDHFLRREPHAGIPDCSSEFTVFEVFLDCRD